jgi:hypothetical protein
MTIPLGRIQSLRELLIEIGKLKVDEQEAGAGYSCRGTSSGHLILQRCLSQFTATTFAPSSAARIDEIF